MPDTLGAFTPSPEHNVNILSNGGPVSYNFAPPALVHCYNISFHRNRRLLDSTGLFRDLRDAVFQ
ncbi:hypothetical protein RhiXN_07487 [Rhizoctonia solani]|uniref:Uncharacterized protein n=1 Tax=Rhizoctonia solani TaxID=456999 RepID=A0A8H8P832_9AGAM|nr:uncharacterized protein RhiXN_07487 [Rhizoctonia solani]QRW25538.1 hypothetical protein RhiXN_07487 [Rhizoctonia solani]